MKTQERIEDSKGMLRSILRRQLMTMTPGQRDLGSRRICERLVEDPAWRQAGHILGFIALPTEPDLLPALYSAHAAGQQVSIPRWNPILSGYEAARLSDREGWVAGPYGVWEPPPDTPSVPFERLDLVLVPGLAFDRRGRRLGRGKGFFDRLLAQACRASRWGVGFDLQVVPEVPAAPHDVNLHRLITPNLSLPTGPDTPF